MKAKMNVIIEIEKPEKPAVMLKPKSATKVSKAVPESVAKLLKSSDFKYKVSKAPTH